MASPDAAFGSQLPQLRAPPPGPASRALSERLRKVESRNVTHITDRWPVFWEQAAGSNVRDADGNVFIDLTGAFGVSLLGHTSRVVVDAIGRQSELLIHGMGDIHPPTVKLELLEKLGDVTPWPDTRTILSSTGSEAVETALKTAQMVTGRPGVLAFEGGYHGLTLGSLSVTERPHFRSRFSERTYRGVAFAPFPDPIRDGPGAADRSLTAVRSALRRGAPNGDPIGSLIVEPVQARGGARVPPDGFMAELTSAAREAGVLIIADEIFSGLGRCGAWLASSRVGLTPDIVCVGKALGGGLPISACLAPADVMDAWPESAGEAIHTSTFLGHPLACAVATDFLEALRAQDVFESVRTEGAALLAALAERLLPLSGVRDVRGMGLLLGIEFAGDGNRAVGAGALVAEACLSKGLIVLPAGDDGHVLELTPPLGLTETQVEYVVSTLATVIGGCI